MKQSKMFVSRLKKKDNDLHNANDRIHTLEDELRNIGSKMSKLEDDHHKVIQELNVRKSFEKKKTSPKDSYLEITL